LGEQKKFPARGVKPHLSVKYVRFVSTAAMVAVLAGFQIPAGTVQAAADNSINSSSVTTDHDSANLQGHHHYLSSAERANDALLITEVKNALADDRVAHDVAIVVDCDHGKILLSGVMKSTFFFRSHGPLILHCGRERGSFEYINPSG
jgi:osmotically-inducible protein OsmY